MPTYEYECKKCSHSFEIFQAMSDEPLKKCPKCNKELRRLINGGAGIIFKGPGFYVTDKGSASSSGTASGKSACPAASAEAKGSTGSADSPCSNCPKNKSKAKSA